MAGAGWEQQEQEQFKSFQKLSSVEIVIEKGKFFPVAGRHLYAYQLSILFLEVTTS